jgi:hypothetical protein
MEVASINERDLCRRTSKRMRGAQSGESAADNDDAMGVRIGVS